MNIRRHILTALLTVLLAVPATADDLADVKSHLAQAHTANDSLAALYDIFDLAPQSRKAETGRAILDIGVRTRNDAVMTDMITQLSVLCMHDTAELSRLDALTAMIGSEEHRRGVALFTEVMKAQHEAGYVTEEDRHDMLVEYAMAEMGDHEDIYARILDLFRMVAFIGQHTQGNMYLEYLDKLGEEIAKLPESSYYLRNQYYTACANAHTMAGNHAKALEADRKLLEVIGQLEDKYSKAGRKYRTYDRHYYICYRRMLRNYQALSLEEVKDIYQKCARYADKSLDTQHDFYKIRLPEAYRLVAGGEYTAAIPALQSAAAGIANRDLKRELLRLLIEVSDSAKSTVALTPALREYCKLLTEKLDRGSEEAYRELQMRYEVDELKSEATRLELEKREADIKTRQKLITVSLAAILGLVVFVMVLYRNLFRVRHHSRVLRDENTRLRRQIEIMMDEGDVPGTFDPRKKREKTLR